MLPRSSRCDAREWFSDILDKMDNPGYL